MDTTGFPARARRLLIATLRQPAGTRLPCSWHEFRPASNFDRNACTQVRERLRAATEAAGFIRYEHGHPWVTQAGHDWAMAQKDH